MCQTFALIVCIVMQSTVFGCPTVCTCSGSLTQCTDNSKITTVPSGISKSTTELHLNDNQITEINVNAFQGMAALKRLYLYRNQITDLNVMIFQGLAALIYLDLSQNPLNCSNCEMSQLKLFLQNQTYGNAGATCNGTKITVVNFDFTDCTATETKTLNTTNRNLGSTSEDNKTAVIAGTVTGAVVVVVICVITFLVIRKVCSASDGKTVVQPSI
ncbi:protein slit-like [Mytilus californianus]|uniref:protein slit-like n=1 Tax=Mytilus californianus TaxID=6549 RepID=UPI002247B01D|nr:protein slit-like [Mytilus californianus]